MPARGRPLFVVYNGASGAHDGDGTLQAIGAALREARREHEILGCDAPGGIAAATRRAVQLARTHRGGLVAAGGDGTLNTVAQAALADDLPFGAIALGTFNYFARAQSLPLEPQAAARAALAAELRPVQVGLVNGRVFLVNASLGLYPQLLADRERFKQRFGRSRAVAFVAALATILRAGQRLRLAVETPQGSRTIVTAALVVDNNRLQLEQLGLPEAGAVDAGRLVAMFVKPAASGALFGLLARALLRGLQGSNQVERLALRRLQVTLAQGPAHATVPLAIDGEPLRMQLPVEFTVAPRPLRLIAPA